MSDLAYLTIAEAARLIRTRKLSPVELARALLARIAVTDSTYHAYIAVTEDLAIAQAQAAEAAIMRGEWRGPMHGVPYAAKDIFDIAGMATTCHSKLRIHHRAAADATAIVKLREAGAVLLGKLALHEFATGGPTLELPWPAARNPWNLDLHPGGSSSGSGVAVAIGTAPGALGTDTGGSVRNPATCCGVIGMKPTYGTVSRAGVFPLAFSLDHVGPLTRTVEDNAIMLQAIAGHDPADPASADEPVPDYSARLEQGVKGLRIGIIRHFYTRDLEGDPEMIAAIDAAVSLLAGQGADTQEITLPPLQDFAACGQVILAAEAYAVHERWLKQRPQDYGARGRERLLAGASLSAADYLQASRWRLKLRDAAAAAFRDIDVAITASSLDPACRIDDNEALTATYSRQARIPFNVTGQPALVIPAGFSKTGLPLSLQIVGHPFAEATVYRAAAAYEAATRWPDRHPAALV